MKKWEIAKKLKDHFIQDPAVQNVSINKIHKLCNVTIHLKNGDLIILDITLYDSTGKPKY